MLRIVSRTRLPTTMTARLLVTASALRRAEAAALMLMGPAALLRFRRGERRGVAGEQGWKVATRLDEPDLGVVPGEKTPEDGEKIQLMQSAAAYRLASRPAPARSLWSSPDRMPS